MLSQKNSKLQGNIGIGRAISHFTTQGHIVSIPITDSQDYDLVVDINNNLQKIQVKTTRYSENNCFKVNLKVCGGNKSSNTIKNFDNNKVDILFVLTEKNDIYIIPSKEIKQKTSISLNDTMSKYKWASIP